MSTYLVQKKYKAEGKERIIKELRKLAEQMEDDDLTFESLMMGIDRVSRDTEDWKTIYNTRSVGHARRSYLDLCEYEKDFYHRLVEVDDKTGDHWRVVIVDKEFGMYTLVRTRILKEDE